MSEKIIIVGAGIAAISAVKAIREVDQQSEIIVLGEEEVFPYNRMKLSKGLLSNLRLEKILLEDYDWYQNNQITLHLKQQATGVDPASQEVILTDNSRINYTKLILATGASNATPAIKGIKQEGVFTLRSLIDAKKIREDVADKKRIVVIGGGVLGLEMAWVLAEAGKEVVVVELSSNLMSEQLDSVACTLLERKIKDYNVEVLTGTAVEEIIAKDRVDRIITSQGQQIDCEAVIYSTGINPNLDIIRETDIKRDFAIIVNNKMETNYPDIYAAGDVSEIDNKGYGLWSIAIEQGKVAGYNVAGRECVYKHIAPVVMFRGFDLILFSIGTIEAQKADYILKSEGLSEDNYIKVLIKDEEVIGAIVIGDISKAPTLRKAISNKIKLTGVDFENIGIQELLEEIMSCEL